MTSMVVALAAAIVASNTWLAATFLPVKFRDLEPLAVIRCAGVQRWAMAVSGRTRLRLLLSLTFDRRDLSIAPTHSSD